MGIRAPPIPGYLGAARFSRRNAGGRLPLSDVLVARNRPLTAFTGGFGGAGCLRSVRHSATFSRFTQASPSSVPARGLYSQPIHPR